MDCKHKHRCADNSYRCQYEENGKLYCVYAGLIDEAVDICPICGHVIVSTNTTRDGRVIAYPCMDAYIRPDERKHYVTDDTD